ncbi:MAG: DNA-protecting protein DprA [Terrimonas sp.]|nr:DNA-protecting protein DprA [Terrimonas sp.]
MTNDLLYQLALTEVPHIGHVHAKILVQEFGSAENIFKAKKSFLDKLEGIGAVRAKSIKSFTDFSRAEKEISFIEKYQISPLFLTDKQYPRRLLHCYDPPTLLFYKGTADLNAAKIIAIIGTRSNTEYGKKITEQLLKDMALQPILVISGLAFGIDAIAHKTASRLGLPTVGILAHGLDQVYPTEHAGLAREMLRQGGGLLTEYRSQTKPDKHNFPTRNRIVAGMCDATIVIETSMKGGSMITAELANGYNKDVFAFPGKTTDSKSAGCNYLIRTNKAILITGAKDMLEMMGWEEQKKKERIKPQKELFIELTREQKIILELLKEKDTVAIDEINIKSNLSSSAVAAAILTLELQNIIISLPGKLYKIA